VTPTGRHSVAVVLPVALDGPPPWTPGPLPLQHGPVTATSANRSGYFSPACARVLYGHDGQPHRWHQTEDVPIPGGCLFGLDLFRADPDGQPGDGLLVAHLRTTIPEILPLLRGIAHRRGVPPVLPVPAEILPEQISLRPTARPYTAAFLTWSSDQPPELGEPAQVLGWDATDQWRWALASRTTRHDFPPDPDHADALLDGTVIFSADWRGLINRDGAAFVALRPDQGNDDPYFGFAQLYTHSVYLDALLLGMTQRAAIDEMTDDAARSFHTPDLPRHLATLEHRAARFRAVYWLRTAGIHGHANDVLTAYQQQHQLADRFDIIISEISDLARVVQTQDDQQVSAALGIITVLGLPVGLALSILQTIGSTGTAALLIALAASLAATVALLLGTRFGRLLARALRPAK